MADYDYDIGIIGGGAAGLTVASGAAQLGAKTIIIEKEEALGGDCLHYGCVPSKTLIKTAHVYNLMKNGPIYGLPSVSPPPVDFKNVAQRIRFVIETIQRHDSVERFCRLGAAVKFGRPTFLDEHTVKVDKERISSRNWVIATGSSPAIPPIPGIDKTPYLTNKDIFSLESLPESMIILGAGPIAVEMAQAFNRLGTHVTMVQRSGQILSKEDKDMADLVQKRLEEEGVIIRLNSKVVEVNDLGPKREVVIEEKGGDRRNLTTDAIFIAMGRTANVSGLGLDTIGIHFDRRGIKVNSYLKTTHKHIYAAGDVIGGYQFTHVAGYEGGVVLRNAIFHLPTKVDYRFVPWCTYTHPELASIGMNEKRAKAAGIEYKAFIEEFNTNDRAIAEGEEIGRIKMLLDTRNRPLGVQILGPRAGDILNEWVAIMNGGTGLAKIASAMHPYPTLGEINKKVIGNFYAPKIFSKTIKKGLGFFFSLKGRACICNEDVPCEGPE